MPTTPSSKYRPEIDGLRAFAVVAVIINHFNKDLLPSGYLGVDIFFVISGYVITSSLAGRESKNFLDFLTGFYERRIKRLVPALVVFVLITSVLISLVNPEPGVALGLGWRSLFGISNINLYQGSTDYFAQSTELNPFTHTWSLGVEEQFYLLFPFLIWFSGFGRQTTKGSRNLFCWVGVLTIASLIGFIYLYQVNQPAAYFLMPPRFWEMAAGCLLFIGFQKRARIEQALEKVPPLLVVAAIIGVMYLPVVAAVPATIGIVVLSAVLIACLKRGTVAYKFFTLEKVVYIGLISYSLYLWHWTVLSISRWTIGIHWWSAPFQAIIIILFPSLSYAFVESPARKSAFIKNRRTLLLSGGLLLASSSAIVKLIEHQSNNILLSRIASIKRDVDSTTIGGKKEWSFRRDINPLGNEGAFNNCHLAVGYISNSLPEKECTIRGKGSQTVYFAGNSHSEQLRPLQASLAKFISGSIYSISVSTCTFPSDFGPRDCRLQRLISDRILHLSKRGDLVIISNRYPLYEVGSNKLWTTEKNGAEEMSKFVYSALKKGVNVVLFAPTPEFRKQPAQCAPAWFNLVGSDQDCVTPESRLRGMREQSYSVLSQIQAKGGIVFDPMPFLCPKSVCSIIDYPRSRIIYPDASHLSDYAVKGLLERRFFEFLKSRNLVEVPKESRGV